MNDSKIGLRISYFGLENKPGQEDIKGYDLFVEKTKDEFDIRTIRSIGGLGGGLYDLFVEFLFSSPIATGVIASAIYDLSKIGVSTILKHLESLAEQNVANGHAENLNCSKIKLEYDDITVYITTSGVPITINLFSQIFPTLVDAILDIEKENKVSIKEIHIPLVSTTSLISNSGLSEYKFCTIPDYGMEKFTEDDFFKFWGITLRGNPNYYKFDLINRELTLENWFK